MIKFHNMIYIHKDFKTRMTVLSIYNIVRYFDIKYLKYMSY